MGFVLALFLLTLAAPATPGDASSSPPPAPPKDDAVVLEETLEIDIVSSTQGRARRRVRTQALTARGVDLFDVATIPFRKGATLRDVRGATIAPDGKRTEVKKAQMADRADFESYELYSDAMERWIQFPGVVPGAIVEYSYVLEVTALIDLPSGMPMQDFIPVRSRSLRVRAPRSFPIRVATRGAVPEVVTQEEGDTIVRTWSVKDVPPLRREDNMPPFADLIPRVTIMPLESSFDGHPLDARGWDGIARFDWELHKDRIEPAPEVAEVARRLTGGAATPEAKTRALFEFAQREINYVAVEVGIGGWQPHANADVLRHRYGDCKDKAALLIAMMRAVGLTGYMVSIRTRDAGLVDRDSPGLWFNHAIVAVPAQQGYLFLDPTDPDTPYGDLPWRDQGVPVLIVKEAGALDFTETPLHAPERNRRHRRVTATVTAAGDLEGTYVIEAWGQRRAGLADLLHAGERDKADALEDLVAMLCAGAVMSGHEVAPPGGPDDPIRITLRFSVPRFVGRAGNLSIVSPHLARVAWLSDIAARPNRRHPVLFPHLMLESSEVRLALPPAMTLRKVPAPREAVGPGLSSRTRYETTREGDREILIVRREITVGRREIPAEEYPALRAFLSSLGEEEAAAVTLVPRS